MFSRRQLIIGQYARFGAYPHIPTFITIPRWPFVKFQSPAVGKLEFWYTPLVVVAFFKAAIG